MSTRAPGKRSYAQLLGFTETPMKRLEDYPPSLVEAVKPLAEKVAGDGPITNFAYLRLASRILRKWSLRDYDLCEDLAQRYDGAMCSEVFALVLGKLGVLDADGVLQWAKTRWGIFKPVV